MGAGEEILVALKRIEGKVDSLIAQKALAAMPTIADDASLDSKDGNPVVKITIKKWHGPVCKGRKYSECSPEFLDVLANTLTWMAENPQAGREKYSRYNMLDAARARGWAKRLRGGWKPPADEYAQEAPAEDYNQDPETDYND